MSIDARKLIEKLIESLADIDRRGEDFCDCGSPHSAHRYWSDAIYDVNGRDCPNTPFRREWSFSAVMTASKRHERMAREIAEVVVTALQSEVAESKP